MIVWLHLNGRIGLPVQKVVAMELRLETESVQNLGHVLTSTWRKHVSVCLNDVQDGDYGPSGQTVQ